jgi:hypothetical protein
MPLSRVFGVWLLTAMPLLSQIPATNDSGLLTAIDYETARLERVVTAVRITEEISLDGVLDEPAWELASPAGDFIQKLPNPEQPSVERVEVLFLYDDDNIYVGVTCFDSDSANRVVSEITEDFNFRGSDSFSVLLDSLHDLRSGMNFIVNAEGAKADQQISDGQYNNDWDAVWDVAVSKTDDAWIAEYVIPFKTLRFSNSPSQVWGLNMSRRILRLNEESYWSPLPLRDNISRLSLAGTLRGLEGIRQGRNLKITPFVTAGVVQTRPPASPSTGFATDRDFDGGLDLKYSLTPSLTFDATYRTDFAQVEVDRQQVNLTRFNLFFPEKRDFFLENSATFNFGAGGGFGFGGGRNLVPFFSRRIGLGRSGTPIPIVGGVRVTGKVGPYDVGFLDMKTESVGRPAEANRIPSSNYVVGRLKRNLLTNSWIGAMTTHRDSAVEGDYNRVYGTDAHFEFYGNRLELDSYVLWSDTPERSGRSQARLFETAWRDDEWVAVVGYDEVQTNFNPEVGFVRRRNNTHYNGEFSWLPRIESSDALRNLIFRLDLDYYENGTTEKVETRTGSLNFGLQFENTGSINFALNHTFDRLADLFPIRPETPIPTGDYRYLDYSASFSTDRSARISGFGGIDWGEFWNGRLRSLSAGLSLKPNYHLTVDLDYDHNLVKLPNGQFTTELVGARIAYAFNPRTFLTGLFQYNAETRQVSSNIRFNLIHSPLSDLFLVYNDLRDAGGKVVERAVTVKLTNLFNF